ncbi:hypothetical protein CAC42_1740 [Sphaceloma murrayae]|uniref:UNC-45/Cro1/She4 central domain-containing protein n=1 Tax=Sphaceloma murrayae TaxID=2082308 RepID=A0A2K1QHU2_9PEZI|nr:hypothetical protein CAC42_1740 [Sphaceloma murrayae]
MADDNVTQRVERLVTDARALLTSNDRVGASNAAREALQLQPQHPATLDLLRELQTSQSTSTIVKAVDTYTSSWKEHDGKECLKELQQHASGLDDAQAELCLGLLVDRRNSNSKSDDADTCVKVLLRESTAAKKALVTRLQRDLTITFERLWVLGQSSIVMMLSLVLDKSQWTPGPEYDQVLRGMFQLLLTKLIEAGQDHTVWAVGGIVMILGAAPEQCKDLCDPDAFSIILENMDIRSPDDLRKGCMSAMKLMLQVAGDEGQRYLRKFVTAKVARGTNEDLIVAFSAASATFPILPVPAAQLFLTEGFLQNLMPKLQANTRSPVDRRSHKIEHSALELVSAACQDKACRTAIAKYCIIWLQDVAETGSDVECTSLAALVLAKTHDIKGDSVSPTSSRDPEHLATTLANLLVNAGSNAESDAAVRNSIEGLSYLSMEPRAKEVIINNDKLLDKLAQLLKNADEKDKWVVDTGCLTIFSFLTQYKDKKSEEDKRIEQLKAYSESSRPVPEDPLDDDDHVRARCRKVLESELVPAILSRVRSAKDSHLHWIVRILLSLAQEPKSRGRLSQIGSIRALISIHTRLKDSPSAGTNPDTLLRTSHALAKILISVNPNHTFTSSLPGTAAVRPLADLLRAQSDPQISLLATFESLLALTNIASMDAEAARELIIRDYHDQIFDLVLQDNKMVSRAATELVCNLMASPQMVMLYCDGTPRAKHRLTVLVAVTDSEDGAQRRAAGGALAQLTQWDKGAEALVGEDKSVKRVVDCCRHEEGDEKAWREMLHRALVVLGNLIEAQGSVGEQARRKVKEQKGKEVLAGVIKELGSGGEDGMLKGLAASVLQKLG